MGRNISSKRTRMCYLTMEVALNLTRMDQTVRMLGGLSVKVQAIIS
jgi:hypothetical protein